MSKREDKNGNFEQPWKSAFSGAEVTPPSRVWSEIDHGLTQTQLSSLQKKTVAYKWTAAAAVIFAVSLGVMAISFNYPQITQWLGFDSDAQNQELLAALDEESQTTTGNYAGFSILRNDFTGQSAQEKQENDTHTSGRNAVNIVAAESETVETTLVDPRNTYRSLASVEADLSKEIFQLEVADKEVRFFASPKKPRSSHAILISKPIDYLAAINTPDPGSYGVNGVMVNVVKRPILNAEGKTRFWSGVDVVSGYFNPNYSPGTNITSQELLIKDVAERESVPELSENISGGASYSVGINLGMKLKGRWSIEAGVLYSLLGARTFTNLILESDGFNKAVAYSSEVAGLESVANLVESELTKLSVDDIQINNTFQFISFPVQAGYKLIDKRFNVTLNGGLAANLYLGNILRGRQNFSSFELEPGRRSPYKSLTLAAVMGFEMGYWIHRRVNLSFEPTFQKNLQSLTKNDAGFVANPSGVGVQVGFKYDF